MIRLNNENFDSEIASTTGPYLIKFFSPTCGPCATMKPVFEAFEKQKTSFRVFEIDTMESPELADLFNVRGVPFSAFCEERELIYTFTGVTKLADLLYVADNINDPHLRETGQFKVESAPNKSLFVYLLLATILTYIIVITVT